ncbi:thiamine pyrophosphate-dependent dehydrogenase E1 component subunit alpha [Pseudoramibacter alactolyticus]|jgi:pyruvate dehydrogenase E1 component alpha subunit|uniref:thiamine pyrophosphate-dependent dehydrogenase E1 component subunit alpha n=1 Tax=Pseudoramibacter alactolyticus TaxID=113287 RepID=UPI0028E915C7|nr:thiamine pyrophosphate-dependent dehydrogenase E1 component subunit alpha [Pseudoramibacter alactolyticus]
MELNEELLARMDYRMNQVRFFEEKIRELVADGALNGAVHLAIGQEASDIGACLALDAGDWVTMTHRCHGQAIASGMEVRRMMAEVLGKKSGLCGGKAGSLHLADASVRNLGAADVPGQGFSVACGAALTQKLQKTGNAVLCFGGDGAADEGSFHEALNLAAVWQLPVIFFIENNFYSGTTAIEDHMKGEHIADRAHVYGMPGITVDGNDVVAVFTAVDQARAHVKEGNGPALIEAQTYRLCGHDTADLQLYRPKEEVEAWVENDPIVRFEEQLQSDFQMAPEVIDQLKKNAKRSVEEAADFAINADEPAVSEVITGVFA